MLDKTRSEPDAAAQAAAERAQLTYVNDSDPGIRRKGAAKRFWSSKSQRSIFPKRRRTPCCRNDQFS